MRKKVTFTFHNLLDLQEKLLIFLSIILIVAGLQFDTTVVMIPTYIYSSKGKVPLQIGLVEHDFKPNICNSNNHWCKFIDRIKSHNTVTTLLFWVVVRPDIISFNLTYGSLTTQLVVKISRNFRNNTYLINYVSCLNDLMSM